MTSDVSKLMVSFRIQHDLHVSQRLIFILVLMIRRDLQLMIQCKNDMNRRTVRKTARCQKRYSQWNGIFTEIKHKDIKWAFLSYPLFLYSCHKPAELCCHSKWRSKKVPWWCDRQKCVDFFSLISTIENPIKCLSFFHLGKKFYLYASTGKAQENTNSFKKVWRTSADANFVQIRCKEI